MKPHLAEPRQHALRVARELAVEIGTTVGAVAMVQEGVGYAIVDGLVKSGIVLGPEKTACNIPAGIFDGLQGAVVMMHAWGEDYRMSYPAKPTNAPKNWKPEWTVDALFLSTWTGMPGMDTEAMMRGVPQNTGPQDSDENEEAPGESKSDRPKKNSGGGSLGIPLPPFRF